MAYTNPWTNVFPLGSQQAHTADDEFRKLRLDIFERMNDLVESWEDDPVKLKASAIDVQLPDALNGPSTYSLGPFDFVTVAGAPTRSINGLSMPGFADEVAAPIHILPFSTISHINATVLSLSPLKFTLYRMLGTGPQEIISFSSASSADVQNPVLGSPGTADGPINHPVGANAPYWLQIETLGSQQCVVYHVDIQYNLSS